MIPIPVGRSYTATAIGTVWRPVRCEHCGCEFAYRVVVKAKGHGFSPMFLSNDGASDSAQSRARQTVRQKLENTIGLAFCPECGKYQKNMADYDKRKHLIIIGGILLAPVLFAAMVWLSNVHILLGLAVGFILLVVLVNGEAIPVFAVPSKLLAFALLTLIGYATCLILFNSQGAYVAAGIAGIVILYCLYRALLYNLNSGAEKRKVAGKNKLTVARRVDFEKSVAANAQGNKNVSVPIWPQ